MQCLGSLGLWPITFAIEASILDFQTRSIYFYYHLGGRFSIIALVVNVALCCKSLPISKLALKMLWIVSNGLTSPIWVQRHEVSFF